MPSKGSKVRWGCKYFSYVIIEKLFTLFMPFLPRAHRNVGAFEKAVDEALAAAPAGPAPSQTAVPNKPLADAKAAASLRASSMLPDLLETHLELSRAKVKSEIERRAKVAVRALRPPGLEAAAAGAAAAIVLENASLIAERRLASAFPSKLRAELQRAAERAAARLVKDRTSERRAS